MSAAQRSATPADDVAGRDAYVLLDAASANLLGSYASEAAALSVVAQLVHRYGPGSAAVSSLVLYRTDVPKDESVLAEGSQLVRRALTLADISEKASHTLRPARAADSPKKTAPSPSGTARRRPRR